LTQTDPAGKPCQKLYGLAAKAAEHQVEYRFVLLAGCIGMVIWR